MQSQRLSERAAELQVTADTLASDYQRHLALQARQAADAVASHDAPAPCASPISIAKETKAAAVSAQQPPLAVQRASAVAKANPSSSGTTGAQGQPMPARSTTSAVPVA